MSKFDNILAEAAYAICNHGFAEDEFGSVEYGTGWNALAVVSPVLLRNVGETENADKLEDEYGTESFLVWIREDSQGFVTLVEHGTDNGLTSGTDKINREFDEARDRNESEELV